MALLLFNADESPNKYLFGFAQAVSPSKTQCAVQGIWPVIRIGQLSPWAKITSGGGALVVLVGGQGKLAYVHPSFRNHRHPFFLSRSPRRPPAPA